MSALSPGSSADPFHVAVGTAGVDIQLSKATNIRNITTPQFPFIVVKEQQSIFLNQFPRLDCDYESITLHTDVEQIMGR
ncbi:MAG: hypothetical protein KDK65_08115 [Chlamydiia bacterium]|nr:hypothetical protein [Chlamydiia bacterium]